jgi:plastocyanin
MWRVMIAAAVAWFALAPAAHAERRTFVYRSAPVTMGQFNVEFPKQFVKAPARDGYVVGMSARLVDTHGRAVTIRDVMLHHLVFFRRRPDPAASVCSGKQQEAFYGTGEENQQLRLPAGYGYRVRRADRWRMNAMLMSHSVRTLRVRVEYRVTVAIGERLTGVVPFWVRANGCGSSTSYPVWGDGGPGSVDTRTYAWKVPFDARIVAVGGHLHGGSKDMWLSQPACGDRRLLDTSPRYGMPDDLYYRARPVLHEPGPIDTRYFLSKTGIQVRRGETLRLTGTYDDANPHARVMAIMHIYVVPQAAGKDPCPALPADAVERVKPVPVRTEPPVVRVPLNVLDANGHTSQVLDPPWPAVDVGDHATVALRNFAFSPEHVILKAGGSLTWSFDDKVAHNVTFANGPRLTGSPTLRNGAQYTFRFAVAGRYELFCYLHPLAMHQVVDVQ